MDTKMNFKTFGMFFVFAGLVALIVGLYFLPNTPDILITLDAERGDPEAFKKLADKTLAYRLFFAGGVSMYFGFACYFSARKSPS
jgi:Na+-driven multidrug efflux pump